MNWKTIRIFISSTFSDMHAERDHLVRFVFPELKDKCRRLHVHLIDVDLRWGVTEKDAQEGKALDICLDEIDSCRPYFIGLLGQRYGYVPTGHHYSITAQEIFHGVLHNELPKQVVDLSNIIEGKFEGKRLSNEQINTLKNCYNLQDRKYVLKENISPEDKEIIRSVFEQYASYQKDRSFFFFRKESLTGQLAGNNIKDFFEDRQENKDKLEALKQEIVKEGLPHIEYDTIQKFGELVRDTLWGHIEKEIGEAPEVEKDWLTQEQELHELFMADRTRRFVGRRDLLDRMHAFCRGDSRIAQASATLESNIMLITGEPGCGKSSLMARFTEEFMREHPDVIVIPHFVGASPNSTSLRLMLKRLCLRLNLIIKSNEEVPEDIKELLKVFHDILKKAAGQNKILFIIDAVNQFEKTDNAHSMYWLPQDLPENVRLVISTLAGDAHDALMRRMVKPVEEIVYGLTPSEIEELVRCYLKEVRHEKFPTPEVEDTFFRKIRAGNPLYILIALEELRIFGQYKDLACRVAELPESVSELFDQVLKRIENDFNPSLVKDMLSYIACGRYGMTAEELQTLLKGHAPKIAAEAEATKLPDMLWARLHRSFSSYLFERSGVIDFFHGQLKEAVGKRYFCEETERHKVHKIIADYFETRWQEPYIRALDELPHQLTKAEDWDGVERVLTDLMFIEAKCKARMTYELLIDYNYTLEVLPEAQEEMALWKAGEERIMQYTKEIITYARQWSEARDNYIQYPTRYPMPRKEEIPLPKIVPSVRPWTEEEITANTEKIITAPSRLDRIRAFTQFVNSEAHNFYRFSSQPMFCIQQAYNYANSGPIIGAASALFNKGFKEILLLTSPVSSTGYNPYNALLQTFEGHTNSVSSVYLAPDGNIAMSGAVDHTIRLWELSTGRCLQAIDVGSWVRHLCMTYDKKFIVMATYNSVQIWDINAEEALCTLKGHTGFVLCVCVTPDGNTVVSGGQDKTIRVWNINRRDSSFVLKGHTGEVYSICITPDGNTVVSGSADGTVRAWDLNRRDSSFVLKGHTGEVHSVCITPDGNTVVSGSADGTIRVWDLKTKVCRFTLKEHSGQIFGVATTPDGCFATSVGNDHTLKVWDITTGRSIRTFTGHTDLLKSVSIVLDGKIALSGGFDKTVRVWDITRGTCPSTSIGFTGWVTDICVSPDNNIAVSCGDYIRLWDATTGQQLKILCDRTESVHITPDGNNIVTESKSDSLKVWDLKTGNCCCIFKEYKSAYSVYITATSIAILATPITLEVIDLVSGQRLYTINNDFQNKSSYNLSSKKDEHIVMTLDEKVAITWKPDDKYLHIWDVAMKHYIYFIDNNNTNYKSYIEIVNVCITPDGKMILTASNHEVKLWDLYTGECLCNFQGFKGDITCIVLTPDGRTIIAGISDNSNAFIAGTKNNNIIVWEITESQCKLELKGHTDTIRNIRVTPDCNKVVSFSDDKTIRLWRLDDGKCISVLPVPGRPTCLFKIGPNGNFVCGTQLGQVLFNSIYNLDLDMPIVNAVRKWIFGKHGEGRWDDMITATCTYCGIIFSLDQEVVNIIDNISQKNHLSPDQSPILELPDEAWEDPRLLSDCPHCHKPLRFNPFIVDNSKTEYSSQNSGDRRRETETEEQPNNRIQETEFRSQNGGHKAEFKMNEARGGRKKRWWEIWEK
jgi:telomerase protein component 1